ncbi:MAG: hypothetical protein EHM20_07570, partial [Alphaproteobacteria bacterium]
MLYEKEINKPIKNTATYGITNVKFFNVLFMITGHALIWLEAVYQFGSTMSGSLVAQKTFSMLGFFAMSIPVTAGAVLRIELRPNFSKGFFHSVPTRRIFKMSLVLVLLESLKDLIVFGGPAFFSWNVLHFIALSLAVTVLIVERTKKINGITLLVIISFFIPFFTAELSRIFLQSFESQAFYSFLKFGKMAYLVFVAISIAIAFKKFRGNQLKFTLALILLIGLYTWNGATNWRTFWQTFGSLPLGALLPTVSTRHLWPFFPNYFLFGTGFLIIHYLEKEGPIEKKLRHLLFAAFTFYVVYWIWGSDRYLLYSRKIGTWSELLSSPGPFSMLGILSAFIVTMVTSIYYEKKIEYKEWGYHLVYSQGILFIYIGHFLVGPPFLRLIKDS